MRDWWYGDKRDVVKWGKWLKASKRNIDGRNDSNGWRAKAASGGSKSYGLHFDHEKSRLRQNIGLK